MSRNSQCSASTGPCWRGPWPALPTLAGGGPGQHGRAPSRSRHAAAGAAAAGGRSGGPAGGIGAGDGPPAETLQRRRAAAQRWGGDPGPRRGHGGGLPGRAPAPLPANGVGVIRTDPFNADEHGY